MRPPHRDSAVVEHMRITRSSLSIVTVIRSDAMRVILATAPAASAHP